MKAKFTPLIVLALLSFSQLKAQKLVELWRTGPQMKTPESVLYSNELGVIFVANINGAPSAKDDNGFISLLSPTGDIKKLEWVNGLNAPKGMAVSNGKLYVSDIDQLVEIDIDKSKIINRYPAPDAVFLNDVAADADGTIFVSDSGAGKIYRLKDGELSVWLEGKDYSETNGLYIETGKLYAGSQNLKEIDIASKEVKIIQTGCQGIDGLAKDERGNWVFSNWVGRVFYLKDGKMTKMWDTVAQKLNTADISYAKELGLLLVPTFFDNQIVAYQIEL